jgi:multidrug efflux pump subunit AcrA (membrane-fusion protein)
LAGRGLVLGAGQRAAFGQVLVRLGHQVGAATVVEGGKRVERAVTVGLRGNDMTEITSGIKAGDMVEVTAVSK